MFEVLERRLDGATIHHSGFPDLDSAENEKLYQARNLANSYSRGTVHIEGKNGIARVIDNEEFKEVGRFWVWYNNGGVIEDPVVEEKMKYEDYIRNLDTELAQWLLPKLKEFRELAPQIVVYSDDEIESMDAGIEACEMILREYVHPEDDIDGPIDLHRFRRLMVKFVNNMHRMWT